MDEKPRCPASPSKKNLTKQERDFQTIRSKANMIGQLNLQENFDLSKEAECDVLCLFVLTRGEDLLQEFKKGGREDYILLDGKLQHVLDIFEVIMRYKSTNLRPLKDIERAVAQLRKNNPVSLEDMQAGPPPPEAKIFSSAPPPPAHAGPVPHVNANTERKKKSCCACSIL